MARGVPSCLYTVRCETTFRIRHRSKLSLPHKGHTPPRQNTKGSKEVDEGCKRPHLWWMTQRNGSVLTHKILYNQIDLELFEFSTRPKLRWSPLRLLHQTRRNRRKRNSSPFRVFKYRNRLPLAAASVPEQRTFINLPIILFSILFSPQYVPWAMCPFPIN